MGHPQLTWNKKEPARCCCVRNTTATGIEATFLKQTIHCYHQSHGMHTILTWGMTFLASNSYSVGFSWAI